MSIEIKSSQKDNKEDLQEFLGDQQEVYVYKVLRECSSKNYYRFSYQSCIWDFSKQQVFQIDRSSRPTEEELKKGEIYKGYCVYTNLESAKLQRFYCDGVIVKFKVDKKDVVAVENNCCFGLNFESLVCRKLTFVRVVN
jgi:hypothetical protein